MPDPRCRECRRPMSPNRIRDICGTCLVPGSVTPIPQPVSLRIRRPVEVAEGDE